MKKSKAKWENIFVIASIIFILGCICFYGIRLVHYYKVFNPSKKDSKGLLSVEIPKKSELVTEGKGLYSLNGSYVFKGDVDNNYIKYSGMLFRIVKINYASTIEIILDTKINMLAYKKDSNYDESDINNYLNDVFINTIDKAGLEKMEICVDKKEDLKDDKDCKKKIKVYSTILDSKDYLSSVSEGTYVGGNDSLIYLRDKLDDEKGNVIANNGQISFVDGDEAYDIKPVISLKYDTKIISGTGTKEDPYIVDEGKSNIGKIVTLGDDEWTIINEDKEYTTLTLTKPLDNLKPYGNDFDTEDEKSIAYYLNNDFYNSLSFKDDIVDTKFEIGNYTNNYKEIESKTETAKVGLLSIKDFKLDNTDIPYLLLNKANDDEAYAVDSSMYKVNKNLSKAVRPVIRVKSDKISEAK
jgi:hypothetical protein